MTGASTRPGPLPGTDRRAGAPVPRRVVIVGGGLAAHACAAQLRAGGHDGEITVLGAESRAPYDRPPLSKEFLHGTIEGTALPDPGDVRMRTGHRAVRLEPGLVLSRGPDGSTHEHPYDAAVLAPGLTARRLPGDEVRPNTCTLRTHEDAVALREALRGTPRLAIIGAGWVGAEVAGTAAGAGCRVTVVDTAPTLLAGLLPAELGDPLRRWYEDAGIDLRLGTSIVHIGDQDVELAGGVRVPADIVLVGIGAEPATDWLRGSAVALSPTGHIPTDAYLTTSDPAVYAAGDVAEWPSARFGARLCPAHWDHAAASGRAVARTILGAAQPYDPVPYFWSDQLGHRIQYVGHHTRDDDLSVHGTPGAGPWSVTWRRDARLRAVLTIDDPRGARRALHALREGTEPEFGPAAPTRLP
ncbi:NAD(P)/FAD-dependent oxidoreductase [Embleya sp. AB8]|uniref:NAD(P)/FAD-dependent oxidoreductase n=1 Tax=Embleya sp. AB8 TaxID=3156304 RepID=UPI003C75DAEE